MSRADYAHWNEEADQVWWQEEGRHAEEPTEPGDERWSCCGQLDCYCDEKEEDE